MIKSWFIAFALFVTAIIVSMFIGKRKQVKIDNANAQDIVKTSLDKIGAASNAISEKIKKDSDSNPNSSADELRRDWNRD